MIARVTLEIALRREFDYLVPEDLANEVAIGSRVKVPFGPRQVLGVVTAIVEESPHTNLRSVLKVIGGRSLVTPKVLDLARWISGYYCCPLEIALKSVLPESVRREQSGWKERLFVRAHTDVAELPKLTKKQDYIWRIIEEWRELPLQELTKLAESTADTIRKLEDKGLVTISAQTIERDPYANEHILPTQPLALNPDQDKALKEIVATLDELVSERPRNECRRDAGSTMQSAAPSSINASTPSGGTMQSAAGVPPASEVSAHAVPLAESLGAALADSPFFQREAEVTRYSGWLPHWRQSNRLYFVTFRLGDSIAQPVLKKWRAERKLWLDLHPEPWSEADLREYHKRFTESMARHLDAGAGACLLKDPAVSQIVENTLRHFDGDRYQLGDYVIMPNHVHVLVRPSENRSLEKILHSWKSFSAHEINNLLKQTGPIWAEEYFDHLVRNENQLNALRTYIQDNPVKAKLGSSNFRLGFGSFNAEGCRRDAGSTLQSAASVPLASEASANAASSTNPQGATPSPQLKPKPFLLHGVTGSGKTEVYLQALAHTLAQGKGAIVLVPEISLTPQTVERFKARFSSGPQRTLVAVLHSHLSAGEKHDEWHKIRQGRAKIVIGARSAIFAPVDPLGLIIVDEEHENSYKQEEAPRYHARDVAVLRGLKENAAVVLGSATPSMESFYNVQRGKYRLLELPIRADNAKMPIVRVVDMRQETRRQKGSTIFSNQLREAVLQRLERREQTILFLNRRGYASSMQCPKCGFVAECPNCSVSLTYHRRAQRLKCHVCGYDHAAPTRCPNEECKDPGIRFAGLGTEKVEDALNTMFKQARVVRMDSDTLKKKEDYRRILTEFRVGKIDILVGTQMIAKGLHFPNVTLVGIIHADQSLHMPDFRAGERTFQLLTQVAGRAGRGDIEGEVFVQAFTPFHPAIQYARRHDYAGFYEQEIEFRQQLNYPPLSRIALLTLKGRNEDKVEFSAEHLRKELETRLAESKELVIAGPAPAPLARAETFYRFQLMLRTRNIARLAREITELQKTLKVPDDVTLTVDIDPVNLS